MLARARSTNSSDVIVVLATPTIGTSRRPSLIRAWSAGKIFL
jgi:hypothetical protein